MGMRGVIFFFQLYLLNQNQFSNGEANLKGLLKIEKELYKGEALFSYLPINVQGTHKTASEKAPACKPGEQVYFLKNTHFTTEKYLLCTFH